MRLFLLLVFCIPISVLAQDLTGTWVGGAPSIYLKMVLVQKGDSCYGYAYERSSGFCNANFAGKFSKGNEWLKGSGQSFIEASPNHVLCTYDLAYSKENGVEYLRGPVSPKGALNSLLSRLTGGDYVVLKKESSKVDTSRYMSLKLTAGSISVKTESPQPDLIKNEVKTTDSQPAIVITPEPVKPIVVKQSARDSILKIKAERINRIVETIYTNDDSVRIQLYDNGEIDGDTVTVFFDDVIVFDRVLITASAKQIVLPVKKGFTHKLDLYANNLGRIPPNSALIIMNTGKKRYELRASYDLQSNARILIIPGD